LLSVSEDMSFNGEADNLMLLGTTCEFKMLSLPLSKEALERRLKGLLPIWSKKSSVGAAF